MATLAYLLGLLSALGSTAALATTDLITKLISTESKETNKSQKQELQKPKRRGKRSTKAKTERERLVDAFSKAMSWNFRPLVPESEEQRDLWDSNYSNVFVLNQAKDRFFGRLRGGFHKDKIAGKDYLNWKCKSYLDWMSGIDGYSQASHNIPRFGFIAILCGQNAASKLDKERTKNILEKYELLDPGMKNTEENWERNFAKINDSFTSSSDSPYIKTEGLKGPFWKPENGWDKQMDYLNGRCGAWYLKQDAKNPQEQPDESVKALCSKSEAPRPETKEEVMVEFNESPDWSLPVTPYYSGFDLFVPSYPINEDLHNPEVYDFGFPVTSMGFENENVFFKPTDIEFESFPQDLTTTGLGDEGVSLGKEINEIIAEEEIQKPLEEESETHEEKKEDIPSFEVGKNIPKPEEKDDYESCGWWNPMCGIDLSKMYP